MERPVRLQRLRLQERVQAMQSVRFERRRQALLWQLRPAPQPRAAVAAPGAGGAVHI